MDILHIANGALVSVTSSSSLSLTASTAGIVIPIDASPNHFIYQVRANGYYLYKNQDKGALVATTATTTAPKRNSSVGGAFFRMSGHSYLLHGSGTNYNGGFSVKDLSASKADVYTHAPLGSAAYAGNPSTGAFFHVEQIDDNTVDIHEWCLGNGYMCVRLSTTNPADIQTGLKEQPNATSAEKVMHNGQLFILRGGVLYTITGQRL